MIALLRGVLLEKRADAVVIEAGGVGYHVLVSGASQRLLPGIGAEARLFIHSHAVQDAPWQLFGFVDPEERRVFEALISVQGVGPRVAIGILSALAPAEIVRAIGAADVVRLVQVRGVGRKLAERLAVELRDKIALAPAAGREAAPLPGAVPPGRIGEVWGALVSLGYKPAEFEATLARLDEAAPVAELIKQALAALRRK